MAYFSLLDSIYVEGDLWEKYNYIIIGFIVFIALLFLLSLIIFIKKPESKIGSVLKFNISLISFIINTIFTIYYAKKVNGIYLPSIIILVVHGILNEAFGLFLIRRERERKNKFDNWWKAHIKTASLFTFLSFVDIYSIKVISSSITEKSSFNAPFSKSIKVWIYWVGFVAFVTRDIPQFFIQIIYYNSTLHNQLIPLLNFIISFAVIIFNIFWRINHITICIFRMRYKKSSNTKDPIKKNKKKKRKIEIITTRKGDNDKKNKDVFVEME
ncbi:hypothetical protein Glove_216g128 [Diversispora epigaea]|uniref:Uncharacterized protein n=1 Tax=Diversispora epigaea TaxID=1348612 RepID=A0A397IJS7_9GLOM|nr:hypothetical protein Glove_216g128 [Diversispora epigaea]